MIYTKLRRVKHSTADLTAKSIKESISSLIGYEDTNDFYKSILVMIHPDFKEQILKVCSEINKNINIDFSYLIGKEVAIIVKKILV
jgi:hypothetical protein